MGLCQSNTKILYLTDSYAQNVCGVKFSIQNELRKRKFIIVPSNVHTAGTNKIDGKKLLATLKKEDYTHLWVAHTWVSYVGCTLADINKLNVKVLGFGFSDPYGWDVERLKQYNLYATSSVKLAHNIDVIPITPFITSCDLDFHKDLHVAKPTDVLFIGCGIHPRFKDSIYRLKMINQLRKEFSSVKVFGSKWSDVSASGPIHGQQFLDEINKAKVGIDLEELESPLAHRNFEFPACGTPIITRARYDTQQVFGKDTMPLYDGIDNLIAWINRMLKDYPKGYYQECKTGTYNLSRSKHTIKNRIDGLLNWLDKVD